MSRRLALVSLLALAGIAGAAPPAVAQAFGIGPRLSFVRGDLPSDIPSTRFTGGAIRLLSSPHVGLEAALDHRSETSDDKLTRLRQTPFQGSLLLFLVRSTISPYLLGGIGIYTEFHDVLNADGIVSSTTTERTTGWHFGFGSELRFARHVSAFADYRYRSVRFGDPDEEGNEPINLPGLKNLGITHHGSMWTAGAMFYF
jgi:opacity protein-like surface antigen